MTNLKWLYVYGSHECPVHILEAFQDKSAAEAYVQKIVTQAFDYDKMNHWVEHIDEYKKRFNEHTSL